MVYLERTCVLQCVCKEWGALDCGIKAVAIRDWYPGWQKNGQNSKSSDSWRGRSTLTLFLSHFLLFSMEASRKFAPFPAVSTFCHLPPFPSISHFFPEFPSRKFHFRSNFTNSTSLQRTSRFNISHIFTLNNTTFALFFRMLCCSFLFYSSSPFCCSFSFLSHQTIK